MANLPPFNTLSNCALKGQVICSTYDLHHDNERTATAKKFNPSFFTLQTLCTVNPQQIVQVHTEFERSQKIYNILTCQDVAELVVRATCCPTNPRQIEVVEFVLNTAGILVLPSTMYADNCRPS